MLQELTKLLNTKKVHKIKSLADVPKDYLIVNLVDENYKSVDKMVDEYVPDINKEVRKYLEYDFDNDCDGLVILSAKNIPSKQKFANILFSNNNNYSAFDNFRRRLDYLEEYCEIMHINKICFPINYLEKYNSKQNTLDLIDLKLHQKERFVKFI